MPRPTLARFLPRAAILLGSLGLATGIILIRPTGLRPVTGPADAGRPVAPEGMVPMGKAAGKVPNDWFHRQRAWPGVEVNTEARALALDQARALRSGRTGESGTGDPLRADWQQAGPLNIGGRITALAAHPDVPNRIFAGAADGGVFRSSDGGTSWSPVFDEIGNLSIGALAIDPSDPATVYCGTGEANASGDSFAGIGLLRSTDAGDSWDLIGLESSRHINRIAVDPTDSDRIYVAAMGALFTKTPDRGLYRSLDGGANWERTLFLNDSTGVIDVTIDPSQPSRLYAATWERLRTPKYRRAGGMSCGVWRSLDSGTTWTRLTSGLPPASNTVGRIGLALCETQPNVLYAIYADNVGYFAGLYKSTNGGDSWTRTSDSALSDLYSSFGWYFGNVRVDPTNPNRVFAMGLDIYRSTSGGSGWSAISSGVHVDQHDLWIDSSQPSRMVAGSDGGVYLTSNGGSGWTHVETLPITQFYAGTIDHLNPQRLYGGSQDNGTVRTWAGGLSDWDMIYGGDGFYSLVDPRNSNIIFAEYQYGGLAKSTNGGSSFYSCVSGINSGDRRNWSTPVVFDPSNPDRMYYGTYRLYRSTNAAGSWSSISSDLTGGQGDASLVYATLTTIAVAPSNGQVIYVGTDDARVWRTTNGGGAWQNLSAGLPQRWVTRVTVDPGNPEIAYVAHSGYRNDSPLAHLHRTTNGGSTWQSISDGLPEAPVNAIVIDPENPSWLFAGTDVGVFVSFNAGGTWREVAAGLPITVIHDLALHVPTRTLVAFTHGRSAYRVGLPSPESVEEPGESAWSARGSSSSVPVIRTIAPHPLRRGSGAEVTFASPRGESVRATLHDVSGRLRRDLGTIRLARGSTDSGAGEARVRLDGRDDAGRPLAAGTYYLRVIGEGGVSSRGIVIID